MKIIPSECAAVVLELKKRPRPRSPSLTTAVAVTNTLAGLMSVWVDGQREWVDGWWVEEWVDRWWVEGVGGIM